MKQPIFKKEDEVEQVRISRPGSDGFALFRMVIDPERGDSSSAILGVHEHPPGIPPILPHCHREVEETVYIVSGEGVVKLGWDAHALQTYQFQTGCCWYVPADCYHQIINTGSEPIKMVASYFRNDGRPISHRVVSQALTKVSGSKVSGSSLVS